MTHHSLRLPRLDLPAVALAVLAALATTATGQDAGVCRENQLVGKPVNSAKSELWQVQFSSRDQALMNRIAGQWYSENYANIDGNQMINRQIQSLDASGAFGYQDETCSLSYPQTPCSTNQGYGRWAAIPQQDGAFYIARNVSDLNRQDECIGIAARLQGNDQLIDSATGQLMMQRMQ